LIDPVTGNLRFALPDWSVGPGLTHGGFRASEVGHSAEPFVANAPYSSYKLTACCQSGVTFVVVLWFNGERLYRTSLAISEAEYGSS